jgi:hypothetical protein
MGKEINNNHIVKTIESITPNKVIPKIIDNNNEKY